MESPFYSNINKYLSNGKIDYYKGYLEIINLGLKEGILKSNQGEILFRGGRASEDEIKRAAPRECCS